METSSDLEEILLDLMEVNLKLETRESEMRKVRYNMDDAVTPLCIVCQ